MPGVTPLPPPPVFEDDEAYERSLKDPEFWAPYARAAVHMVGLPPDGEVVTHFPTTHVAALVGERYLVKLHYEDWFGEDCFQTEREAYRLLAGNRLPVPDLQAEGALYPIDNGWRWPFLVMSAMPGRALREVRSEMTSTDLERAAEFVGDVLRRFHETPYVEGEYLSLELYVDMIQTREQRCHHDHELWGSLPLHLTEHVRDYVWGAKDLIDPEKERPVLLHGDLHAGNVFLRGEPGSMTPTGVVDFNDMYVGDRHYDLVAVHLKTFASDKRMLARALEAYGWGSLGEGWPKRMMALTLAHDFDMIQPVTDRFPGRLEEVATLDELATLLWDLDAPGLA
jgi:aminoglycoside phosphotransferase (APT) family kinase protein